MAAKLFSFDGGGGAGKSTLVRNLQERLLTRGFSVGETGFPSFGGMGVLLRRYLGGEVRLSPRAVPHLFLADMVDSAHGGHLSASLAVKDVVLCDRYYHATLVYQQEVLSETDLLEMVRYSDLPTPDRVFILEAPPEVMVARLTGRDPHLDRYDDGDLEKLRVLARRYRHLPGLFVDPSHFTFVNTDRPQGEVVDEVEAEILASLRQR